MWCEKRTKKIKNKKNENKQKKSPGLAQLKKSFLITNTHDRTSKSFKFLHMSTLLLKVVYNIGPVSLFFDLRPNACPFFAFQFLPTYNRCLPLTYIPSNTKYINRERERVGILKEIRKCVASICRKRSAKSQSHKIKELHRRVTTHFTLKWITLIIWCKSIYFRILLWDWLLVLSWCRYLGGVGCH